MDRRQFSAWACGVTLGGRPSTGASQPTKTWRIGVVLPGGPYYAAVEGLREGLNEAGLKEGAQYILDLRDEQGDLRAAAAAAQALEQSGVDILFTLPTSVSVAAKRATARVPIVFWAGNDAVDAGLVASQSRPGGRLTGISSLSTLVTGKRLQLLKEIAPNIRRAITFYDSGNLAAVSSVALARSAAMQLGIDLVEHQVQSPAELLGALATLKADKVDAVFLVSDGMVISQSSAIIAACRASKLPTMFSDRGAVIAGGLASYGSNYHAVGKLAATYVHKVLRGANPAELPVINVDHLELVVNSRTASELGLTIPSTVLVRADAVVQ